MKAIVSAAVLSIAFAGAARAEDEQEDGEAASDAGRAAREKFADGNRKYATGDYAGAEEAFKRAIALDPDLPGPYRNLGLVYVATHRCDQAVARFESYMKLRPESKHAARVAAEIDKCKVRAPPVGAAGVGSTELALVTVTAASDGVQIEGAVVRVDGLTRGGTPLDLQMTPGRHLVRVERVGFTPAEKTVEIQANRTHDVEVELARSATAAGPAATAIRSRARPLAWLLLGASAVAFGVGASLGIAESASWQSAQTIDRATHTRSDVDQLRAAGSAEATAAYFCYGLGGAALALSVAMFVIDPDRREAHGEPQLSRRGGRILLTPSVWATGATLAATGAW